MVRFSAWKMTSANKQKQRKCVSPAECDRAWSSHASPMMMYLHASRCRYITGNKTTIIWRYAAGKKKAYFSRKNQHINYSRGAEGTLPVLLNSLRQVKSQQSKWNHSHAGNYAQDGRISPWNKQNSPKTQHIFYAPKEIKKKLHFSLNDSVLTDISCSVDKKPNIPKPFAVAANYNNEEYVESPPHPGSLHPAASTVPFLQIKRSGNKK